MFAEYGDRSKDVSAKVIVSSIISAANKKMKRKDKNKGVDISSAIEPEGASTSSLGSEPAYNERNIDREIELRRVQEHNQKTSKTVIKENTTSSSSMNSMSTNVMSANTTSSVSSKDTAVSVQEAKDTSQRAFTAKHVYVKRKDSESSIATSSSTSEESWSGTKFTVTKYPAYQQQDYHTYSTENAKPAMMRRYSEDLLSESRRDGDEFVLRPSPNRGLSYQAQQHLRRLQMETQQLRQREEERRIEQEKRALDKHRIEMELQKTKQELEREDSLDELLAKPTEIAAKITEYASKYSDYGSKADSISVTSDYSTTSSTTTGYDNKHQPTSHQHKPSHSSDYSSIASASSVHTDQHHKPHPQGGGKYFVMSSTVDMTPPQLSKHSAADDIQLYRASGLYSPFDTSRVAGRGTLSRKKQPTGGSIVRRTIEFEDDVDSGFHRSGSMRRKGSLDSLLDYYDKGESHGYMSSDSEGGEDLLQSLTATFDQKLKFLLDPKYQSAGSPRRLPPDGASSPSPKSKSKPISMVAPTPHVDRSRNTSDSLFGTTFRDPTLLKPRGDSKVGIASRFERKDIEGDQWGISSDQQSKFSTRSAGCGLGFDKGSSSPAKEVPPSSKSDVTDANLLHQDQDNVTHKSGQLSDHSYARALRKSSEKLYGSREILVDIDTSDTADSKFSSVSPPVRKRDPTKKRRVTRRHTVGGANDIDHFKALVAISSPQPERRESAWDRLQPTYREGPGSPEPTSISLWLQQERLRGAGSTPALFTQESLQTMPDVSAPPIPARYHLPSVQSAHHHSHAYSHPPAYTHDHKYSSSSDSQHSQHSSSHKCSPTSPPDIPQAQGYSQRGRASTFTFESSI